jgi:hypothetical protein
LRRESRLSLAVTLTDGGEIDGHIDTVSNPAGQNSGRQKDTQAPTLLQILPSQQLGRIDGIH